MYSLYEFISNFQYHAITSPSQESSSNKGLFMKIFKVSTKGCSSQHVFHNEFLWLECLLHYGLWKHKNVLTVKLSKWNNSIHFIWSFCLLRQWEPKSINSELKYMNINTFIQQTVFTRYCNKTDYTSQKSCVTNKYSLKNVIWAASVTCISCDYTI